MAKFLFTALRRVADRRHAGINAILLVGFIVSACSASVRFSSSVGDATERGVAKNAPASHSSPSSKAAEGELTPTGSVMQGVASYYGDEFHGRKTANGERYDRNEFSAAHRTLPFGSMLKVRNLANNRTVLVRVNDRGPFKADRILDVSFAAARELDMTRSGTAQIEAVLVQ
jgi:rare lipoprotein A